MIFIDEYDLSFWPKAVFCGSLFIALLISLWMLFAVNITSSSWLHQYQLSGNLVRRLLVAACLIIYFIRLQFTVWVFLKRKFSWSEALVITGLMSFVMLAYARAPGDNYQPVGLVEILGVLLYLAGSCINTHSEYTRHVWKLKKENKGRLHTGGLFKAAMHINYFGDIVLFSGLSLITHKFSMLIVPLVMTLNFIFVIIPRLDSYLAEKYKDEFPAYAKRTKKLFPLIY